jgi:amino acid permease
MWGSRTFLMTILTCAVIAPLSVASSTRIGILGYASFLSFTVMLLLCALAAVEYWKLPCGPRTCQPVALATPGLGTVLALPTLSFAFVCHTAFLPVLRELSEADHIGRSRRPPWRRSVVGHVAIGLAGAMYLWTATFGYLTFGGGVAGDIFVSYAEVIPVGDAFVTVVRFCFVLSILTTVPLMLFPLRRAIIALFSPDAAESVPLNVGLSAIEVTALLGLAIQVPGIKIVLQLAGATSAVMLVFLMPSTFFLRCMPDAPAPTRVACKALFCLGVGVCVLSFGALALTIAEGHNPAGANATDPNHPDAPSLAQT